MTDPDDLTEDDITTILATTPDGWVEEAQRRTRETLGLIRLDQATWPREDGQTVR